MRQETTFTRVFDSSLSDYQRVFRPFLGDLSFRDILTTLSISSRRPLVLDLMTSGANLVELGDIGDCLAVGLQLSKRFTVAELFARGITYLHSDITKDNLWCDVDEWLDGSLLSLALARPEGAYYLPFWTVNHYWEIMVQPVLDRLLPGGYIFFQTPFRSYVPKGEGVWELNVAYRYDEIERLKLLLASLNQNEFETHLMPVNLDVLPRPFFDLLLWIKRIKQ